MRKVLLQFALLALSFAVLYMGLRQVNWMEVFNIEKAVQTTEEKLGKMIWGVMESTEKEVHLRSVRTCIDSIVTTLCLANDIPRNDIKLHILQKDMVNALTLPDDYLVIYTGLLADANNPEEVAGVIGHEIGHMKKDHVMKKLVKEVGLGALVSLTTGGKGSGAIGEITRLLSSSAYDRSLEREADKASVDYMLKASIDPEPFADFMYRMSEEEEKVPGQVYWISTHPESKERAEEILSYMNGKEITSKPIVTEETWEKMQEKLEDL